MTQEMKANILKRVKSLLWRAGCVGVVAALGSMAQQLAGVGLPPMAVTILGLMLGEVSKFVNNHTNLLGVALKR